MKLLLKKVEEVPLANKHLLHGVLLLLMCSNSKCDPQLERCCLCAVLDRSSAAPLLKGGQTDGLECITLY